jgi:hypothetical protein
LKCEHLKDYWSLNPPASCKAGGTRLPVIFDGLDEGFLGMQKLYGRNYVVTDAVRRQLSVAVRPDWWP